MTLVRLLLAAARQWRFPPAFRIPPPDGDSFPLEEAERLLRDQVGASMPEPSTPDGGGIEEELLVRLATGLWRLRQRMVDATGQPREEMRRAHRHLESLWDTLNEFGVEIQDHAGEPFDSGMALVVLSYEHDPVATRETVKETIKPTVYFRDRPIQRGEVIVGSPDR